MESRDSASPTVGLIPEAADDDCVLSATATLAKEAALLFQARKFSECVDVLNQLLQKKPDDPKVLHNIAIVKSLSDDGSSPKKLLEELNIVKKRGGDLAHASGEHVEADINSGKKVIIGSKGRNTVTNQFSAANGGSLAYTDAFETSVATLNIAVIWFHLHEYSKALSVLEPLYLYQNIAPIDETTAFHIRILLLDVALACCDASKSADVFCYLEKAFGVGNPSSQGDNGTSTHQQSTNLVLRPNSAPGSSPVADAASNLDSPASVNVSEIPLSRTISDETLEYETMLSALDNGGQNIIRPANISLSNNLARPTIDRSISSGDLKLKLQLYKIRFLLLTRNLKLAKREVKHAINITRGQDSSMALLLKSQLEYARGNHRKAVKLLMASSNQTEAGSISTFNNNLGCIYYQLGKYHASSVLFSKALANCLSLRKEKPMKLLTSSQDKSLLISYNCGIQYLACGKPLLAARCFQKASLVFYNRPLLWLRLAECCLMASEKGLIEANGVPYDRSEIRLHVTGKGKWRHLVVEDGTSRSVDHGDFLSRNDGQLTLSMSLACQCLLNALHLLNGSELNGLKSDSTSDLSMDENDSGDQVSSKNSNHKNISLIDKASIMSVGLGRSNANGDAKEHRGASQENIQSSLSFYEDIQRRETLMIRQAVLANLAYVELELENPLKALSTARSLLKLPECSRICIFLGQMYAAEALCLLNRPKEAAEHLSIYLSGANNIELPYDQEDYHQQWVVKTVDCEEQNGASKISAPEESHFMPLKPEEARGALYANFATMYALQGEIELAYQFVSRALSIVPNSREATITAVYVDLVAGRSQDALAKLKRFSHIRFLPDGLRSNRSSS